MQPVSLAFAGLTALVALVVRFSPVRARAWVLAAAGAGFVATHGVIPLLTVAGIVGGVLLAARARVLAGALVLVVAHLLAWKLLVPTSAPVASRSAFPGYADVYVPAGLSYLSFRAVHVLVERHRGKLPAFAPQELGAYFLFFPTYLAGPLARADTFVRDLREPPPLTLGDVNEALLRFGLGIAKKVLIADTLGRWFQPVLFAPDAHPRGMVLLAVYATAIQLYVDFSALSDIAIATGRLCGIRVPENFDRPLLKENIAAFWRSWHITLYTFIRDYVFFPVAGFRASRLSMYAGVVASIFLFQVWHRLTWSFVLLGLFHGSAVAIWQLTQEQKRRHKWLRRGLDAPAARYPSILATVSVYAFGNLLFMADVPAVLDVLRRIVAG